MASIPDFEKKYLETSGVSVYFYLIKNGDNSGKWNAQLLNSKEQPFEPDSIFGLFDQVIKYINAKRKPNPAKYKMAK